MEQTNGSFAPKAYVYADVQTQTTGEALPKNKQT
jgi:hypothetical protein